LTKMNFMFVRSFAVAMRICASLNRVSGSLQFTSSVRSRLLAARSSGRSKSPQPSAVALPAGLEVIDASL
jgi:hypothetical protein